MPSFYLTDIHIDSILASLAILTITPLTLTLPFALGAYLFVAHTLGAPGYAAIGALLAGGVTALVGKFCVGLVEDTYVAFQFRT